MNMFNVGRRLAGHLAAAGVAVTAACGGGGLEPETLGASSAARIVLLEVDENGSVEELAAAAAAERGAPGENEAVHYRLRAPGGNSLWQVDALRALGFRDVEAE